MSRLLFAAARGARIEKWGSTIQKWFEVTDILLMDENDDDRIHPDDAHLQYGPISTALRGYAAHPPAVTGHFNDVGRYYINIYKFSDELYMYADELHRSLFLLILAEALADEGL